MQVSRADLPGVLTELQNVEKYGKFALSTCVKPLADNFFQVKCKGNQTTKCKGALLYKLPAAAVGAVDVYFRSHCSIAHEEAYLPLSFHIKVTSVIRLFLTHLSVVTFSNYLSQCQG